MEKKSKSPVRRLHHLAAEEVRELQENLMKLGNSSEGMSEKTNLAESTGKKVIESQEFFTDEESATLLKYELEAKQNIIASLTASQKDLKQSLITLKAQNTSLMKELNICRSKNYELDVEIYLVKDQLTSKNKELEKNKKDLEFYQNIIEASKSLKTENFTLKEQLKKFKAKGPTGEKAESKRSNSHSIECKIAHLHKGLSKNPSVTPEKFYTDRVSKDSSILTEVQNMLSLSTPQHILPNILYLKESIKTLYRYKKFFNRLAELVNECTPSGIFESKPNFKQVWVWITRLLEEYMKIKKTVVIN